MNKKNDYVTNKLLLVFTLAFALILLLMNISRMMKSTATYLAAITLTKVSAIVAGAAVVLGIVMMIIEHSKKTDTSLKLFSGKNITIGALFVAICLFPLTQVFRAETLTLLYIFVPSVIVLYIIYYSYPREFFMITLACIVGGIGIWLLRSDVINSKDMLALIGAAAVIVLEALFTVWAQLGGGKISLFGRELSPFKKDARFGIVYLTFALVLALLAASFLAADLAIYFIFGLIAYIVIVGVYYTVKLI